MERLTYRDANGEAWYSDIGTEADRLHFIANIEDILGDDYDLDRLRELVTAYNEGRYIIMKDAEREGVSRLVELAEADRDERVVVLPCKIGENVYSAIPAYGGVNKHQIRKFEINKEGEFACCALMIPFSFFGKSVFLTREAAEEALKGEQE